MVYFSPSLLFSLKEKDFHPEVVLSVGPPLKIIATFLYLTRVLFSPLIPDAGIADLLLKDTCFFFYLIRLTELFHSQSTVLLLIIFFLPHMYFLYLFLSFDKELFQLLNFTFSCTLIAFIKGLFLDRRVKIMDILLLASYKTHRLLFPFLCASQNNTKCNEFSMASCGFTFRIVVVALEKYD